MKAVAKTVEPERDGRFDHIRPLYLEALTLVERLHRRLLDVIKDEFDRRGRCDAARRRRIKHLFTLCRERGGGARFFGHHRLHSRWRGRDKVNAR